jgi:hypothetical protein
MELHIINFLTQVVNVDHIDISGFVIQFDVTGIPLIQAEVLMKILIIFMMQI